MAVTKHICEFGTIWNSKESLPEIPVDQFNCIHLEDKSFQSLKNFVAENNDPESGIDQAFSLHRQKGKDFIRVKNFVGVIETRQGTVIEILPKIYNPTNPNETEQIKQSKSILLKMLRSLKNAPFKSIDSAHLKTSRVPIIEIFISVFLQEMEILLKRGIKHFYVSQEENQLYLKGRLVFSENIKKNIVRRERFYVNFDEFNANIAQNRILKSALIYIRQKSRSSKNIRQIINLLYLFDEVKVSQNLEKDLLEINGQSRLFNHYQMVLQWAKVFLLNESFTSYKGNHLNTAIIFPMEILFESYVAHKLRQYYPDWDIITQDRRHYLMNDLIQEQNKFRLRPDIVINTENMIVVADTKWKIIDETLPHLNYNISQSDMYQLYAYGKKYQLENKPVHLVLIYPQHENFNKPLHFEYENMLQINVLPYEFDNEESSISFISHLERSFIFISLLNKLQKLWL
ncbi:McrC family protein [Maribellus sediminis]|uniref:McrC family protein n=1 Tax=Maribellus sediminis TaxID=2696285 RepID=UPI00142FBA86|nr:McrC family protein [Maribellus sediminis]